MIYTFIKITNNDDISDFTFVLTSQKKWQNRMSGLRHQAVRYFNNNEGTYKNVFRWFTLDYSHCKVAKKEFNSLNDAKGYIPTLMEFYDKKFDLKKIKKLI